MYVVYITYMLTSQGSGTVDNAYEAEADGGNRTVAFFKGDLATTVLGDEKINLRKAWLLMLLSVFFIGIACYWLVEACQQFGEAIGMPIYFVSVVLASAATSVPDTIISWKDAMKGNYDDAVANALGSNIFDICFALGFPLFLFTLIYGPIMMSPETLENVGQLRVLLLIITIVAFFIYLVPKTIRKSHGYLLIALYALFVIYIILKGMDSDLSIITSISSGLSSISQFFSTLL
jgi:cation:H+ antiporter